MNLGSQNLLEMPGYQLGYLRGRAGRNAQVVAGPGQVLPHSLPDRDSSITPRPSGNNGRRIEHVDFTSSHSNAAGLPPSMPSQLEATVRSSSTHSLPDSQVTPVSNWLRGSLPNPSSTSGVPGSTHGVTSDSSSAQSNAAYTTRTRDVPVPAILESLLDEVAPLEYPIPNTNLARVHQVMLQLLRFGSERLTENDAFVILRPILEEDVKAVAWYIAQQSTRGEAYFRSYLSMWSLVIGRLHGFQCAQRTAGLLREWIKGSCMHKFRQVWKHPIGIRVSPKTAECQQLLSASIGILFDMDYLNEYEASACIELLILDFMDEAKLRGLNKLILQAYRSLFRPSNKAYMNGLRGHMFTFFRCLLENPTRLMGAIRVMEDTISLIDRGLMEY